MKDEIIKVEMADDHLRRTSQCSPSDAITELIWNGLDAGATKIQVGIEQNDLGGVEKVTIKDNGCGISEETVGLSFGTLGKSTKPQEKVSPRNKPLHGKVGEGRFKAYQLGSKIEWRTKTKEEEGFLLSGNFQKPLEFQKTTLTSSFPQESGTIFTAYNTLGPELKIPLEETLAGRLTISFAPVLLADSEVSIFIGNIKLNPQENIEEDKQTTLLEPFTDSSVRTVVWKKGESRELYWCDKNFLPRGYTPLTLEYDGSYTIFIASPLVEKAVQENTLLIGEMTELNNLKEAALEKAKEVLEEVIKKKARSTIELMKQKDIYPYKGEPQSELDQLERGVFDVCTSKIIQSIPSLKNASRDSQRLTFHLLKQAIETHPSALREVLRQVLNLPQQEIEQLSELLERVTLSGLIKLGKTVSDRLAFLRELEPLVFDPTWKKHVKERKHLHKIIEKETWIFGEQFALGTSDENFYSVLEHHKNLLGHDIDEVQIDSGTNEGMEKIPDLVLGRQFKAGPGDKFQHLVVELKRPSVKIGMKEKSQIETYANTIGDLPNFDKKRTNWIFYAVSTAVDSSIEDFRNQQNRPHGQTFVNKDGSREIWIKTWAEIIQSAKDRMEYLKAKLETQSQKTNGLKYIKSNYPEIMAEIEEKKVLST